MTLRYPYELRKEDEYFSDIPDEKISKEMLQLAEHIVDTKAGDFDPDEFEDTYETAVVDIRGYADVVPDLRGKAITEYLAL